MPDRDPFTNALAGDAYTTADVLGNMQKPSLADVVRNFLAAPRMQQMPRLERGEPVPSPMGPIGDALKSWSNTPGAITNALGMIPEDVSMAMNFVVPGAKIPPRAKASLPMDEASRMARAKEMGFDTGKTWYHGTDSAPFDAFDKSKIGAVHGDYSNGFHLTSDPSVAEMYGSATMPLLVRPKNPLVVDYPRRAGGAVQAHDMDRTYLFNRAMEGGHDGILVRGYHGDEHYIAFDPKNIRSKFAAFDPDTADSANLMGGVAGGGGLVGLAEVLNALSQESEAQ